MMLIFILLLKAITALISLKNNLKIVGYYLFSNLILDCIGQLIKYLNHYPKPYSGIGLILFAITTFIYLANASILLFFNASLIKNISLKNVSILGLTSLFILIMVKYPIICGSKLLIVFYSYYLTTSILSIISLLSKIKQYLSWSLGIMLMLSLGSLIEVFILLKFSFLYYWLISVCNCTFYFAILLFCGLIPKYRHLLKP